METILVKLGENLGASYHFCEHVYKIIKDNHFSLEIFRLNQAIPLPPKDAEMLHYLEKGGTKSTQIEEILREFNQIIEDSAVFVELYKMYQIMIVK
ncbi:MAG: hypothetical protein AB7E63_12895 [Parachlamydia sp.]|jgi:hypothetical protein|nr:hypothetical protein pah_c004o230 [Parachlamydia acanthamoebae str. Hall's coccus]